LQFDIVAFSITYEEHIFEIAKALEKWKISPFKNNRSDNAPLLLGGGIGLYYNPVPFFPMLDVIYLGEAEERMEKIFENLSGIKEKKNLIQTLSGFDNIIVTENYKFKYKGERTIEIIGEKKHIFRSDKYPERLSCSCFITEETVFKNIGLIEINRGCTEKCRFCVASTMGLPYREKKIEIIEKEIASISKYTDKIGLIGTSVTEYSKMEKLHYILKKYKVKATFSSLKVSQKPETTLKILKESEQKTVTLAPETGREDKRIAMNKKVKNDEFFHFCEKLFEDGAENLKLYFLTGIPEETEKDLEAIAEMVREFHSIIMKFWKIRKKTGKISVSVNPLIAKPFTPMQWYGMPKKSQIEKNLRFLKKLLGKIPNTSLSHENTKNAIFQAVISRGDERVGVAAIKAINGNINFRKSLKEENLKIDSLYTRERDKDEFFPWEVVNSGIKRKYLRKEYENIYKKEPSPKCFKKCKLCGLC